MLRDSGYFSTIEKGVEGKGLHLKVRLVIEGSRSARFPEILTTISLFTIPSWATYHFPMKANITTPSGRKEELQLTNAMTLVRWFPLILVAPFRNSEDVIVKKRQNIYKNLLIQMRDKQLFN